MLSIILVACKRNVIQLFTTAVTEVSGTTAVCGGDITDDNGQEILTRGVCWSTSPKPTCNDSHVFAPEGGPGTFTCILTCLQPNTTYYVRAFATCSDGISYGIERTFTTNNNLTVTDVDGNVYNTVTIGDQVWMRENLRTTRYADGTSIPDGTANLDKSYTDPYRYFPNGQQNLPVEYGLLYNWSAVMHGAASSNANPTGVQGICPNGWHVPSRSEWNQLKLYVKSQPQFFYQSPEFIAKSLASTSEWDSFNLPGTVGCDTASNNATGFSALPAGYCDLYWNNFKDFYGFGEQAHFSSSSIWWTEEDKDIFSVYLSNSSDELWVDDACRANGFSVRCVQD